MPRRRVTKARSLLPVKHFSFTSPRWPLIASLKNRRRGFVMLNLDSKRKRETLTLILVFVLVLGISALAVYLLVGRPVQNEAIRQTAPSAVNETTPERRPSAPTAAASETFLDRLFGAPRSEAHTV